MQQTNSFFKKNILIIVLIIILCLVLGFYGSLCFINKFDFTLDKNISIDINPIEIFSMILTVVLAVYITNVLDKNNDIHSKEIETLKDFFYEYRADVIKRVNDLLASDKVEIDKINSSTKFIRRRLYLIKDRLIEANYNPQNDTFKSLEKNIKSIWTELTYSKSDIENDNVVNSERILSKTEISVIENYLIEVEKDIFKIIFEINKCK